MPLSYPYIQYGGIWTTSQATDAVAAGTWAVPPQPHLFAWGYNASGQLGTGNTTYFSSPKQIGSLTNWLSISAANSAAAVAIKTDGTLWTWGQNSYGNLGLGNTTYYSSPKQVGVLTNWSIAKLSGALPFVVAVKTDGTLWSWGYGGQGNLGLGNTANYSSPKQVGALTNWAYVSSGGAYHVSAIKTDGSLWTWGWNTYGQLGLGSSGSYIASPKQVGSLTNWTVTTCCRTSTFAIKTDGTLWAWGGSPNGQLGLGNTTSYSSPKQIGSLTDWLNISANGYSVLAVKTDGTLWGWGQNSYGQLGLGNTTYAFSSPQQIGSLTNWSAISCGSQVSLAIKTDGTLWSWGAGNAGQLGLGNTTNYSSPKQVGTLTTWQKISGGSSASFGIAKT